MSIYECNVLRGDELLEQNPPTRFENAETRSGMGMIIADGIRNSMSLAGLASQLDLFLNTIEIHRSADGVESLNFNDQTPPPDRRLKIDLRTDDRCHATPHFHLIHNNNDTTYDTKDFNRLGGAPVDPETAEMVRRLGPRPWICVVGAYSWCASR